MPSMQMPDRWISPISTRTTPVMSHVRIRHKIRFLDAAHAGHSARRSDTLRSADRANAVQSPPSHLRVHRAHSRSLALVAPSRTAQQAGSQPRAQHRGHLRQLPRHQRREQGGVPSLAGQSKADLVRKMQDFKAGHAPVDDHARSSRRATPTSRSTCGRRLVRRAEALTIEETRP